LVFTFGTAGGTLLYARNFISLLACTTCSKVAANEWPPLLLSGAAPSSQFPAALARIILPVFCRGALYTIALYLY
ncbi:hypothetical protein T12_3513, partial [Trichinella patagoniensis]